MLPQQRLPVPGAHSAVRPEPATSRRRCRGGRRQSPESPAAWRPPGRGAPCLAARSGCGRRRWTAHPLPDGRRQLPLLRPQAGSAHLQRERCSCTADEHMRGDWTEAGTLCEIQALRQLGLWQHLRPARGCRQSRLGCGCGQSLAVPPPCDAVETIVTILGKILLLDLHWGKLATAEHPKHLPVGLPAVSMPVVCDSSSVASTSSASKRMSCPQQCR